MSEEPIDTLIPQFTQFIIDENLNPSRFATINKEFGVDSIARGIHDFYDDWHFRNPDRAYPTVQFFEQVYEEKGEKQLLQLMQRIYDTLGGGDGEMLRRYSYLEVFERGVGFDAISGRFSIRPDLFIEVENIPGTFYPSLIDEINLCYRFGADTATLVLSRKLLENLVIDALRGRYGVKSKQSREIYFNENNGYFHQFSDLLEELDDRLQGYQAVSPAVNPELIRDLKKIKAPANAQAHSIEEQMVNRDMEMYSNEVTRLARILFDVREKLH